MFEIKNGKSIIHHVKVVSKHKMPKSYAPKAIPVSYLLKGRHFYCLGTSNDLSVGEFDLS